MAPSAKRLTPRGEVLKELFLKSGNLCAYPNCKNLMMNAAGKFIGQLCHIEAAEAGGQRFNVAQTDEQRREFGNLLLLCYEHHQVTNDVLQFPVAKMREIKADHEARFTNPHRAIVSTLKDWTADQSATLPKTLHLMFAKLGWDDADELREPLIRKLELLIKKLERTPEEVRAFICALLHRAERMRDSAVIRTLNSGTLAVLASDVESALKLNPDILRKLGEQLDAYDLGGIDQVTFGEYDQWAVCLNGLKGGEPFWSDLVDFCAKAAVPVEAIVNDLDFARLDGTD